MPIKLLIVTEDKYSAKHSDLNKCANVITLIFANLFISAGCLIGFWHTLFSWGFITHTKFDILHKQL